MITNPTFQMKKIILRLLLLPLTAILASLLSCQDHHVPPTPPAIQTNDISVLAGRVGQTEQKTDDLPYPVIFNCEFTSLGIGASDITEYGVLFVADYNGEGTPAASELVEGATSGERDVEKVVFEDDVVLNTNIEQYTNIRAFYRSLHFRAYAKSAASGVLYGEMLEWKW